MSGYQPHFDHDYTTGKIGENLVDSFLACLAGGTIETKTERKTKITGNHYVETWKYRKHDASDKVPSGINITTADYWAIASDDGLGFVVISVKGLKELLEENRHIYTETHQPNANANSAASIGRLVPMEDIYRKIGLIKK